LALNISIDPNFRIYSNMICLVTPKPTAKSPLMGKTQWWQIT